MFKIERNDDFFRLKTKHTDYAEGKRKNFRRFFSLKPNMPIIYLHLQTTVFAIRYHFHDGITPAIKENIG